MLLLKTFQKRIFRTSYVLQQIFLFNSSVQRKRRQYFLSSAFFCFKQNHKGCLVCAGVSTLHFSVARLFSSAVEAREFLFKIRDVMVMYDSSICRLQSL